MSIKQLETGEVVVEYSKREGNHEQRQRRRFVSIKGELFETTNGLKRVDGRLMHSERGILANNGNIASVVRSCLHRAAATLGDEMILDDEDLEGTSSRGRPSSVEGGRRVSVYLDEASLEKARILGQGNISEGLRQALAGVRVREDQST